MFTHVKMKTVNANISLTKVVVMDVWQNAKVTKVI